MGSIAFSAQALGRLNDAWRGLFLSALIMLIFRPEWIGDLGFILSFVATASLMLFEKRIRKRVKFLPDVIRQDFSTSLAAQIGVAPIIYVTFGQFNILSPVINALVLWTIAPITIIGMVGGIVSLLSIPLGKLILLLSFPLTSWFVFVVQLFG
jgi:competence protein ComEC